MSTKLDKKANNNLISNGAANDKDKPSFFQKYSKTRLNDNVFCSVNFKTKAGISNGVTKVN